MVRNDYSSFSKGTRLILQAVCMFLVCFGLVAGAVQEVRAATPPAPVLAVQASGTAFALNWSQPTSTYGAPDGGYDIIIDGVDTNKKYRTTNLSTTISGLTSGTHTFQVEARFTELSPRVFSRSNEVSAVSETSTSTAPDGTPFDITTVPVLESVQVSGTDFVLSWSQPDSVYGAPDGGYDIIIDGVDSNKKNRASGLSTIISGLAEGEHTFQVEARFTELSPSVFSRSNVLSAVLGGSTPIVPVEPTAPDAPSAPVLNSVQVSGSDFVLSWSQPDSVYGAPDGGYDIFINGVDQNNHTTALTETISGLAPGAYTFKVEARFTEVSQFLPSNEVSAALLEEPAPTPPDAPSAPVLNSVQVSGSDFVMSWSQPDSVYGAPDGGYDIFIDGVDQNNHTSALSKTISGLVAGTHSFKVEARFTEVSQFLRSNEMSATLEGSVSTDPVPTPDPTPAPQPDPSLGYLPVFPGAQGFGTETKAGRGGKIIKVTNLNDSGSGSLRAAVAASGARIIVFEVSGTIKLSSDLKITNPYVTVAGQTAPSPGITLRAASLRINTHDVLVQHLRVRVGDDVDGSNPATRDGITIYSSSVPYNVVVDHVSASWAVDGTIDCSSDLHDVTISNSILSEGLRNSIHPKGAHSLAMAIGDRGHNIAVFGNLFAHNKGRNPGIKGDTSSVILNNLMYDAGSWAFGYMQDDRNSGPSKTSYVGNLLIEGPSSDTTYGLVVQSGIKTGTELYFSGNSYKGNASPLKIETSFDPRVSSPPVWHPSLTVRDSSTVEVNVLANAGARPADRDAVDDRIVNEVKNRGGNIIDSPSQVGGWPNLAKNTRTFNVPSNPNGDDDGDGYTNIEEVLQQMAAQVEGR